MARNHLFPDSLDPHAVAREADGRVETAIRNAVVRAGHVAGKEWAEKRATRHALAGLVNTRCSKLVTAVRRVPGVPEDCCGGFALGFYESAMAVYEARKMKLAAEPEATPAGT